MEKNEQIAALSYAVRGRVVLKYTGPLALIQAVLKLVPALKRGHEVAIIDQDKERIDDLAADIACADTPPPPRQCGFVKTLRAFERTMAFETFFVIA